MTPSPSDTYLGFDLSTQKLKAVLLNSNLEVLVHAELKFDIDLPEFQTAGGVNTGSNENEYFVQPVMWVKALDMVLDRLVVQGANLSTVSAIGGSAQQHGSVYWSEDGIKSLKSLDADKFLHFQLSEKAFTLNKTPIWMDGSTEKQCAEMEKAVGGTANMVAITGSKCYQRFTGPQIRKIFQTAPKVYEHTFAISLVSSFLASIFIGDIAPIDYADASGMNLFDIQKKNWSDICLKACAPDLEKRLLHQPVSTCSVIGNICPFFVQRYGFKTNCKISAFTGDNPSAFTGMLVSENWLAISLGTSDTVMMTLSQNPHLKQGHVLCHPTDDNAFMGLLCFRNGSLVRDIIKRVEANNNWDNFSELLNNSQRGNRGNMALHFQTLEIIPKVIGTLKWNENHNSESTEGKVGLKNFNSAQTEVRALIEGQMLHRKSVAQDMGFHFGEDTKILATGGASVNKSILQVMSDVFNAPVYTKKTSEAALLGAAYRAKYCLYLNNLKAKSNGYILNGCGTSFMNGSSKQNAVQNGDKSDMENGEIISYQKYILQHFSNPSHRVCTPGENSSQIYNPMLSRYREMVNVLKSKRTDSL
ncbi:xylulose kinase [Condylostylus longicornis]|uniref:xylulose kinase n=1 Tax=Condylostylus longicornis TaxID=2530218 RepID=UPI00244E3E05|nr:xylulose kinase [Condylostylus longicornis]